MWVEGWESLDLILFKQLSLWVASKWHFKASWAFGDDDFKYTEFPIEDEEVEEEISSAIDWIEWGFLLAPFAWEVIDSTLVNWDNWLKFSIKYYLNFAWITNFTRLF